MEPVLDFGQAMIAKAVGRLVARAQQCRAIVSAPHEAAEIALGYPACPLGQEDLIREIAGAAVGAGVAVRLGPPLRQSDKS